MLSFILAIVLAVAGLSAAAPAGDLVKQLPDFPQAPFKIYSGYLKVPGPFDLNEYDSLSIHYQFHEAQTSPETAPVATWHQGGPGGSSFIGLFTEMGDYQLSSNGSYVNEYSWNKVANMLYLESPAGSSDPIGFSTCIKGGSVVNCRWNDKSQAEAYAHTLKAFFAAFPEFRTNELYITGEVRNRP
eukprot:UC1_evm1s3